MILEIIPSALKVCVGLETTLFKKDDFLSHETFL